MLRIKTHTPVKLETKIIKVSESYTCEIIYSQIQLSYYGELTSNDSWQAITDNNYYGEITENRHFLVFRRNGYQDFKKVMTDGFPCDTYGSSLLLVQQSNDESDDTFFNCLTRWNNGDDCAVRDLNRNTKYVSYNTLKNITGLTDITFKKIYKIWQKVSINISKNTIDIPLIIKEKFGLNINQEDLYNNQYVKRVEEENVNKIIDYEKKQFVLNYITNDSTNSLNDKITWKNGSYTVGKRDKNDKKNRKPNSDDDLRIANSLSFNLYFRDRDYETGTTQDGLIYYDYGEWETDDSKYWVDTNIQSNGFPSTNKKHGDNLYCLGFTDDDVHYQKENLKKSFLRLSVYDSPYRQTQKLLYYSTLFFDTNVLYKNYIDVFAKSSGKRKQQFVYDSSGLTATFTCSNKFKQDASSDGFYLYLFDKMVEGNTVTPLYLKVEFNNAKTGKTVPLLWSGEDNTSVGVGYDVASNKSKKTMPKLKKCPQNYYNNGKTDIKKLLEDLYIPIGVKYNNKTNEYVWFIIYNYRYNICPNNDGNIVLNLFEPRINQ